MASTSGLAPEALKGKTRTEVSWSSPTPGPKARSRSLLSHKARCGIITLTLGELSVAKTNNVHTIRSFSSRHWPSLCDGKSNTCLLKYNTEIMWWGRSYLLGFVKIITDAHDLINIISLIYGKEKVSVSVVSKTENASGWENCLSLSRRDSARLQDCLINVAFVSTLHPKCLVWDTFPGNISLVNSCSVARLPVSYWMEHKSAGLIYRKRSILPSWQSLQNWKMKAIGILQESHGHFLFNIYQRVALEFNIN